MLPLLTPGCPMFFVNLGPNSGQQRENGTNQKIRQTWVSISLCFHLSLPKSTLPSLHTSTTRSTVHLTLAISSKHSTLSSVPSHWLCHFLHKQTSSISSQFSAPQMQELKPTTSIAKTPPLSSVPRSIQTSLLQLPYNMPSWSNPLTPSQIYISFTLTSTHTYHQHISPYRHLPQCIQAGLGIPTAKKKLH